MIQSNTITGLCDAPAKTDVAAYLKSVAGAEPLYYFPNPGNAGDSLIAAATFQLFEREGIAFELATASNFDAAGKIVVYGGGGNLVDNYGNARKFIARWHESAKRLILLPHSIAGHEALLPALGGNVDLIAREWTSYHYAREAAPNANVLIADDMALGLDCAALLARKLSFKQALADAGVDKRKLLSPWRRSRLARSWLRGLTHPQVFNCFRIDEEKTEMSLPEGNADISELVAYGTSTPFAAAYAAQAFLRFLSRAPAVRTNRLHVSIGCALLGKQVDLFPNNYFKCEAVYRFSIEGRFPNVRWKGKAQPSAELADRPVGS